ncbi:MAG: glycosyltransferase family 8 protein [Eubacteriales bacterium]
MINVLVTLNQGYINPLRVMLRSLCLSNPELRFRVFVAHSALTKEDFLRINSAADAERCEIVNVCVADDMFQKLPYSERWPQEACFRIFAAKILSDDLDRVLYLDPDLVVINNIEELYSIDFDGNYFAATSHMLEPMNIFDRARLGMTKNSLYINSGVMLMNLELLRKEQNAEKVFDYVRKNQKRLWLFDQDILNGVYCEKTLYIDPLVYNLDEKYFKLNNMFNVPKKGRLDHEWVKSNTVIVHFCGKNKPWKEDYKGEFGKLFYQKYADKTR